MTAARFADWPQAVTAAIAALAATLAAVGTDGLHRPAALILFFAVYTPVYFAVGAALDRLRGAR